MIVVDASVAVKWFIWEDYSQEAADLLVRSSIRGERLIGPDLLPFEYANAIYWQRRRGVITLQEEARAIAGYASRGVEIIPYEAYLPEAMDFARMHDLPAIYDAIYIVLAREYGAEFWTDDRRLLKAAANQAPWVHWLGEWQIE